MKHEERRRVCVPLQGVVILETSYISLDDCFAALQIDLSVRGWIGAFATLAAYAIPISSQTMSFPADSTGGNLRQSPLPKTRRIIALPTFKSNRKPHFALRALKGAKQSTVQSTELRNLQATGGTSETRATRGTSFFAENGKAQKSLPLAKRKTTLKQCLYPCYRPKAKPLPLSPV